MSTVIAPTERAQIVARQCWRNIVTLNQPERRYVIALLDGWAADESKPPEPTDCPCSVSGCE